MWIPVSVLWLTPMLRIANRTCWSAGLAFTRSTGLNSRLFLSKEGGWRAVRIALLAWLGGCPCVFVDLLPMSSLLVAMA